MLAVARAARPPAVLATAAALMGAARSFLLWLFTRRGHKKCDRRLAVTVDVGDRALYARHDVSLDEDKSIELRQKILQAARRELVVGPDTRVDN